MVNKKYYLITAVAVVLIIGGIILNESHKKSTSSIRSSAQNQNPIVVVTSSPATNTTQPTPITSQNDIGSFSAANNGQGQLYKNSYLGIQMIVPKNWTLEDIYDKNFIVFRDVVDATDVYNKNKSELETQGTELKNWLYNEADVFQIKYYTDFKSWHDENNMPDGCVTIKTCYLAVKQSTGALDISESSIGGVPALVTLSTEGDAGVPIITVENKGIYEFTSTGFTVAQVAIPYKDPNVLKSLQFLK